MIKLDTSHLEAEAERFLQIVPSLKEDDYDLYDFMTRHLKEVATEELGPYVCGLDAELCLVFDDSHVEGQHLTAPDNAFAGRLVTVSSVMINPSEPDEPLVPSLIFAPRELHGEGNYGRYDSMAFLFPRVAVPLVGVPFNIEAVALLGSDYLYDGN